MANLRAHNPENYDSARGVQLWLRNKDSADEKDWNSAGSIKGVTFEPKNTTLAHFANYLGQRAKDREITTQRELSINFSFEEFNIEVLKLALGFGFDAATAGTKAKNFEKTVKNPGPGLTLDLGKAGIANLQVRSSSLEDDVTYTAGTINTDTTDDTDDDSFNTTATVVVAAADYPGIPTDVGSLIRIASEILRLSDFSGGNLTFTRGAVGTTAAAHADGADIFKAGAGDYYADLTSGKLATLVGGDLEDNDDVPVFHVQYQKDINVHKFELFPGDPIECEAQLYIGEEFYGPFEGAILKNNGALPVGDGSDWRDIPMTLEITVDGDGSFGEAAHEDEDQS